MIAENSLVKHKSFGIGTVVACQGKYMKIKFTSIEKTFVYPDAFDKFLTLPDGTVSDEIRADLDKSKAEKQAIIDKKNEEQLHTMIHGIVIPGKEAVTFDGNDTESRLKSEEPEEI